jgi:hypothetical protein
MWTPTKDAKQKVGVHVLGSRKAFCCSGAIGAYVPGLAVVSTTAGIWAAGLLIVTIFYIIILAFRT